MYTSITFFDKQVISILIDKVTFISQIYPRRIKPNMIYCAKFRCYCVLLKKLETVQQSLPFHIYHIVILPAMISIVPQNLPMASFSHRQPLE